MPETIKWGPKSCVIESSRVIPFSGLKITQSAKTETQTSDGNSVVNVKGKDALNVAFSVTYLVAAGVDPYANLEEWLSLVGQAHPLYIGGKRIGPEKLTLQSVEVSNTRHTNKGEFLGIDVAIALKEYTAGQVTKPAASTKKSSGSKSGGSGTLKNKVDAMKATATKSEKSLRKPGGAQKTSREAMLF